MLVLTALVEDPTIPKSDSLPQVDISVKTLKNPNEHIFATKKHNENKFDYHKIQVDNKDRQPVLFEHMTQIHLTRSKYIITSYLNFDELDYVAVSEHPDDVVPISNCDYNQLWSFFHYENLVLGKTSAPGSNNIICARKMKNSSSSSGVLNNSQPKELLEKGASSSGTLSENELDYYDIDYPDANADDTDADKVTDAAASANADTDHDDTCDDADEDGMDPQLGPKLM